MRTKLILVLASLTSLLAGCNNVSLSSSIEDSKSESITSDITTSITSVTSVVDSSSVESISTTTSIQPTTTSEGTTTTNSSSIENTTSHSSTSNQIQPDFALEEWTTFSWYEGRKPMHNENFTFFWNDKESTAGLWECPNEKALGSGIEFSYPKKQYMESPYFKSWKKIEFHMELWFSGHQSSASRFAVTKGQPQLIIKQYDINDNLLDNYDINIERSDVPNNSTCKDFHFYIRNTQMSYFELHYNNPIPNGNDCYTPILHEIRMKGWDYE